MHRILPSALRIRMRRGSALTTSILTLMVTMTLGMALLQQASGGLNLAERSRRRTLAFNLAESGAERGARWLEDQPSPPSGTSALDPFSGAQTLGDGTYSVSVQPDANNSGATLKRYTMISTGTVQGRSVQVQLVMRQSSFGRYAYFTDREVSSISGGAIWFFLGDRIRGPAHSNNTSGTNFHINWSSGTGPIFQDMVTAAGSTIAYSPSSPATPSDYLKIFLTGTRGLHLGVNPIPFPSSSSSLQQAAWGASSGFPSTTGVYVPTVGTTCNGGIYIAGDAAVTMQLDGSGNQQFVITQGSTTTTLTVDRANNQLRKQVGSGPVSVYIGCGNGALYCSGNVTSLSGTVADNLVSGSTVTARNSYTIATDVNNGKNITVTGPITYHSAPDPTQATTAAVNLTPGTLGLYARNVIVGNSCPTSMEIDAVMMAGSSANSDGSFYVNNYSTKTPTGTLKIMGGVIQMARGPVGTISGGVIQTGYAKNYYYDPRLADNPPPYFPTTGNYDRVSWQRTSSS